MDIQINNDDMRHFTLSVLNNIERLFLKNDKILIELYMLLKTASQDEKRLLADCKFDEFEKLFYDLRSIYEKELNKEDKLTVIDFILIGCIGSFILMHTKEKKIDFLERSDNVE